MASIAKRQNGMWRARYRDEAGKEHARHFVRKIEAQRWLDEVTASVVTGQYVDPHAGKITFASWWKDWSERQIWTDGTREAAQQAANSVTFANVPLKALRQSHLQTWIKAMSEPAQTRPAGLAASTIRTRFNYVHMSLRAATLDRRLSINPAEGVRLPRKRPAEAAMTIPTTEEVRRAFDAAAPEFRAFVGLAAFAGLRLGEAAGVQVGDVDFLRRALAVRRQVQGATRATTKITRPKYGSERTVPIPTHLVNMLAHHVETIGTQGDERWLFFRGSDRLNRNSAGNYWRSTRDAADLSDEYTLHDLRHFYASALIAAGCDVVTVQRALGHKSASITLNTYAHLWPTAEDGTRSAAADLMHEVLGDSADSLRTGTGQTPSDQG